MPFLQPFLSRLCLGIFILAIISTILSLSSIWYRSTLAVSTDENNPDRIVEFGLWGSFNGKVHKPYDLLDFMVSCQELSIATLIGLCMGLVVHLGVSFALRYWIECGDLVSTSNFQIIARWDKWICPTLFGLLGILSMTSWTRFLRMIPVEKFNTAQDVQYEVGFGAAIATTMLCFIPTIVAPIMYHREKKLSKSRESVVGHIVVSTPPSYDHEVTSTPATVAQHTHQNFPRRSLTHDSRASSMKTFYSDDPEFV